MRSTTATTTTTKRLLLPILLIISLTLLSFSSTTTTTDARAIPQKRSPDASDDDNNNDSNNGGHSDLIVYPPGKHDGHTPYLPGKGGGSLSTDKRRKKRSDTEVVQAETAETGVGRTFEKRNLFSRLLNINRDRGHHPRHRQSSNKLNVNNINDENDRNAGGVEEYFYWNAEGEDDEGIDEEDDLGRHGGIYEDDDDDDDKGRYEDLGLVSQGIAKASTPIVIEPSIRHPAHGSSLFDTDNSQDQAEDSNNYGESNNKIDNEEEEDLDRIRATHPWYQNHQYPSSSSSSSSSKHHADNENDNENDNNILKNQIWIVDEWDEDFDGVEETIDDLIDWIDDLDHVRARPASASATSGSSSSGVRHLFF